MKTLNTKNGGIECKCDKQTNLIALIGGAIVIVIALVVLLNV